MNGEGAYPMAPVLDPFANNVNMNPVVGDPRVSVSKADYASAVEQTGEPAPAPVVQGGGEPPAPEPPKEEAPKEEPSTVAKGAVKITETAKGTASAVGTALTDALKKKNQ